MPVKKQFKKKMMLDQKNNNFISMYLYRMDGWMDGCICVFVCISMCETYKELIYVGGSLQMLLIEMF